MSLCRPWLKNRATCITLSSKNHIIMLPSPDHSALNNHYADYAHVNTCHVSSTLWPKQKSFCNFEETFYTVLAIFASELC